MRSEQGKYFVEEVLGQVIVVVAFIAMMIGLGYLMEYNEKKLQQHKVEQVVKTTTYKV